MTSSPSPESNPATQPLSLFQADVEQHAPVAQATERPMRLGLLAGAGEFPIQFAVAARNAGHYVYGLGVAGMASEKLFDVCDEFRFAPLARMGKSIRLLRNARVDRVIMAGKIEKTVLFHPFRWKLSGGPGIM